MPLHRRPNYKGGFPSQPDRDAPHGVITYEFTATGDRGVVSLTAGSPEQLDQMVVERLGTLYGPGKRIVKTQLFINGDEWVYEYDSTGRHVEHVFKNGEVTP